MRRVEDSDIELETVTVLVEEILRVAADGVGDVDSDCVRVKEVDGLVLTELVGEALVVADSEVDDDEEREAESVWLLDEDGVKLTDCDPVGVGDTLRESERLWVLE